MTTLQELIYIEELVVAAFSLFWVALCNYDGHLVPQASLISL
jgi:hypothetical protein